MLFSLAALVEQHPSKLVLHSLAGALNFINQHDGTDGTDIMLAWPSRGLNQCHPLNLLKKRSLFYYYYICNRCNKLYIKLKFKNYGLRKT